MFELTRRSNGGPTNPLWQVPPLLA